MFVGAPGSMCRVESKIDYADEYTSLTRIVKTYYKNS